MRSEFYVINLVKSNEEACRRVAECLGLDSSLKRENVIYEISRRNVRWRFMSRYECNWEDIFEQMRAILDREIEGPGAADEGDLDLLTEPKGKRLLAEVMECAPGETLQALFSSERIQELLRDTGIARPRDQLPDDAEWLISALLADTSRPKLERSLGSEDFWALLYELMHPAARQQLAEKVGCPECEVLRVLVRRIKQVDRPMKPLGGNSEFGAGSGLDAIALSKFRVLLHLYRYRLIEEAKSQAHRAKSRLPGCRTPAGLPPAIEYYISGDFRSALQDLLSSKEALRGICSFEKIGSLEQAPRDARIELVPMTREGDELAAGVWCVEDQSRKRTEVLRLRYLDAERLKHIQEHLPKLIGELPQTGSTIAERVLNVMLPPASEWKRLLRAALASKTDPESPDDAFIQSLVLSRVSLRPRTGVRLDFGRPPEVPAAPDSHVEFPLGVAEIADRLREEYRLRGKELKTIQLATRQTTEGG